MNSPWYGQLFVNIMHAFQIFLIFIEFSSQKNFVYFDAKQNCFILLKNKIKMIRVYTVCQKKALHRRKKF